MHSFVRRLLAPIARYNPIYEVPLAPQTEILAGYHLEERIGNGGFGEVWKARAPGGLFKAIKILHGRVDSCPESTGAEIELKALKRICTIRHPFLLSLERFDIVAGRVIIVTELAERSLADRYDECVRQGLPGIPRGELLRYIEETAEVLDLMNQRHKLLHLDIKPENLFLVGGHVKVADFGLVSDLGGTVVGMTVDFAAPELFDFVISEASDQYSLAIVYQEMLTGGRPYTESETSKLIAQHHSGRPNLTGVPESDRPVLRQALAPNPENRFQSCTALVQALAGERSQTAFIRPLRKSSPGTAPPPTVGEAIEKGHPRHALHATITSIRDLPMFPEAAQKALTVAQNPNSASRELIAIVERDQALATAILKMANSVMFSAGRSTASLTQAVARLGMTEVQNVIMTVSMRRLFRNVLAERRWRCEVLFRHALLTAGICRRLNHLLNLGFAGEEYACGVCHDLGRILITLGAPDICDRADPLDFLEVPGFLDYEREALGGDHVSFGANFARLQRLPQPVIDAIEYHHDLLSIPRNTELVLLLATADHLANFTQRTNAKGGYHPQDNPGWALLVPKLKPYQVGGLPQIVDRIAREVWAEVEQTLASH